MTTPLQATDSPAREDRRSINAGESVRQSGMRTFLALGSINAFLSVALGAFGAHALQARLAALQMQHTYETGVHYHMMHALGLILIALLYERLGATAALRWSGWLLTAGIVLFSGSLYVLAISGIKLLGAITPFGGLCFLAGWALLIIATLQRPPQGVGQ